MSEWIFSMNGRFRTSLSERGRIDGEVLSGLLCRIDGRERYALCLWQVPVGSSLNPKELSKEPNEYIQMAGTRDRFTVEVSRMVGSVRQQFVVGISEEPAGHTKEVIYWENYSTDVFSNEVFTLSQVKGIFDAYLESGEVPSGYSQRPLDVRSTRRVDGEPGLDQAQTGS